MDPDLKYVKNILLATEYNFGDELSIMESYNYHKGALEIGMERGLALSEESVDLMLKGMIMQGKMDIDSNTGIWTLDISDFSFRFLDYLGSYSRAFSDIMYSNKKGCIYIPCGLIDAIGLDEITKKED